MKEQQIDLKTAILAKEKSLDVECCQCVFVGNEGKIIGEMPYSLAKKSEKLFYIMPTQSLLQKWLRDVHNIAVLVDLECDGTWFYQILSTKGKCNSITHGEEGFNTYEVALEAGLFEGLKLIH